MDFELSTFHSNLAMALQNFSMFNPNGSAQDLAMELLKLTDGTFHSGEFPELED